MYVNLKDELKRVGGYLLPILVLLVITCIYFYPALEGYSLRQGDVVNWKGMAQEALTYQDDFEEQSYWTNSMFGGMPTYQISASYKNILPTVRRFIELNLPNPMQMFFLYGLGFYLMLLLMGVRKWQALIGAFMYAFSTYFIVIIEAGHNTKASALGMMPVVFGALYYLYKNKTWFAAAIFSLFLALEISINHYQITYYLGLICVIYVASEAINAFKDKDIKPFLRVSLLASLGVVLAVLPNLAGLLATADYGTLTTRGGTELTVNAQGNDISEIKTSGLDRDYATSWSYGLQESFTLLVPNTKGGKSGSIIESREDFNKYSSQDKQVLQQIYSGQSAWSNEYVNSYWGNQRFTSGPVYVGAIVFFLALLFLALSKNSLRWPLLIATILSLFLSWGRNFMPFTDFFFDFIPGYNKFRTVSMTLIMLEMTLPLMAVLFIKELLGGAIVFDAKTLKKGGVYASSLLVLLLLFLIVPNTFFSYISDAEQSQLMSNNAVNVQQLIDSVKSVRIDIFKADVLRSLLFILVSTGFLYAFIKGKLKANVFIFVLAALILMDLWPVNKRYLNNEKDKGKFIQWQNSDANDYPVAPTSADIQILDNEIVINNLQKNVEKEAVKFKTSLDRPRQLNSKELAVIKSKVVGFNTDFRVLNLSVSTFNDASTSYFHKSIGGYHGAKLQRYQDVIEWYFNGQLNREVLAMLNTKYIIQNGGNGFRAVPNDQVYGNAWFVKDVYFVESPDEEIKALATSELNTTAIINSKFKSVVNSDNLSGGEVKLIDYKPNKLQYNVNSNGSGLLIFSEIYYADGWHAYVDDKEVDIIQANYILRAINVEKGVHKVVFEFQPEKVLALAEFSLLSGIILIVLVFTASILKLKSYLINNIEKVEH